MHLHVHVSLSNTPPFKHRALHCSHCGPSASGEHSHSQREGELMRRPLCLQFKGHSSQLSPVQGKLHWQVHFGFVGSENPPFEHLRLHCSQWTPDHGYWQLHSQETLEAINEPLCKHSEGDMEHSVQVLPLQPPAHAHPHLPSSCTGCPPWLQ